MESVNSLGVSRADVNASASICSSHEEIAQQLASVAVPIDIDQDSHILHRQLAYALSVAAKDCPAADISGKAHDFRKYRAVQQNGVTAKTFVERQENLRLESLMAIYQLLQSFRLDERLVGQDDQCCFSVRRKSGESGAQRAGHSFLKRWVDNNFQTLNRNLLLDDFSGKTEDEHDLACTRLANGFQSVAEKSVFPQAEELLWRPHAPGHSCRQDNRSNSWSTSWGFH